jgi:hypothetical protein
VRKAQIAVARLTGLIDDKRVTELRLHTALENAENCVDALFRLFRNENSLNRGELPAPAYFNDRPKMRQLRFPEFGIDVDKETLSGQEQKLATLLTKLDVIRANIQASFNRQYDRLMPLDTQFEEMRKRA